MSFTRLLIVSLALLVFAGCGIPEEQYNAKVTEAEKLKADLDAAAASNSRLQEDISVMRSENQTLANRLAELGENVQKLLGEKGELKDDLAKTRQREARLRRERETQRARMAKYRKVINKFKKLVSSGKLKIRIVRGRMVVEMASNILFPSGKAKLHTEGEEALGELAGVLQTIRDRNFQVAGHTDNVPIHTGRFKSNWELSTARSVTVVKFLQEAGVDPLSLSASGYAEYEPTATNETKEGKAQNRRIEIVLMPNLDELPDMSKLEDELGKKPNKNKNKNKKIRIKKKK
ncbi:MAG: OmpA family protein [Proteobacteria bacterium]|nr:OmpA family protein [Pseudomonadota bacterium]